MSESRTTLPGWTRSAGRAGRQRMAAASLTAALFGGAVLAAGPALAASSRTGHAATTCPSLKLGARSSGRTVTIKPCATITISLSDCTDCGYQWKLVRAPNGRLLKRLSSKDVRDTPTSTGTTTIGAPAAPVVGGEDTFVTVYRGLKKGETTLGLTYYGPDSVAAAGSFALTVKVS